MGALLVDDRLDGGAAARFQTALAGRLQDGHETRVRRPTQSTSHPRGHRRYSKGNLNSALLRPLEAPSLWGKIVLPSYCIES